MTPEHAQQLWEELLRAAQLGSKGAQSALDLVFNSVLIDYITNNMARNEEFAMVIGQRIEQLRNIAARVA